MMSLDLEKKFNAEGLEATKKKKEDRAVKGRERTTQVGIYSIPLLIIKRT